MRWGWVTALCILACNSADATTRTFVDEGAVCVASDADSSMSVRVVFPMCLSSTCETLRERTCSVSREGDQIVVKSRAVIEREGSECSLDCGIVWADCRSEPIEPGEYNVVHGQDSGQVTLPLASTTVLGHGIDGGLGCP